MYSQCPECLTRFRVTAAALRVAHGTVRCGRCGSAFDALQRLTDTVPDDAEGSAVPSMLGSTIATFDAPGLTGAGGRAEAGAGGGDAEGGTDFHFSADDIEQVFIDARDWQKRFPRTAERVGPGTAGASGPAANHDQEDDEDDDVAAAATASTVSETVGGTPVMFVHEPEAIEDITLEGERIVIEGLPEFDDELRQIVDSEFVDDDEAAAPPDDPLPHPDSDPTDQFEALRETSAGPGGDVRPGPVVEHPGADGGATIVQGEAPLPPIVPYRLRQPPAVFDEPHDLDSAGESIAEGGRSATVAWGLGALVLAIALVAQTMHHYRQDLARDVRLGPVVRGVYARLGAPLAPNWDLPAFEVRQWGANASAPSAEGAITVRASLRNGAGFAQPLPLLRLEFEDRFGGTVARRDFEPAEYLNDPGQASRLLAPGAKTEAKLDVVAVGTDAVGYRLDVCMREASGAVHCAQSRLDDGPRPQ